MKKIVCKTYNIFINDWDALKAYIDEGSFSMVIVIVDENIHKYCLPIFKQKINSDIQVIEIESGENNKDLVSCAYIWNQLVLLGADRHSLCINLGGGVIGDMGGFVAATFMRGMDFIQVPTTLLSQVDASVGGKLGVDFDAYKNLIGIIKNPGAVFIFIEFLETLPADQLRSGFAEMLKHGLIQDEKAFDNYSNFENLKNLDWETLIHESVLIKKNITEQDPEEKGLRKILNFGHTLGHAIESYNLQGKDPLLHGEAIAIGIILESHLSYQLGKIDLKTAEKIKSVILKFYGHLSVNIPPLNQLLALMSKDKKNRAGKIKFSLLEKIGQGNFDQEVQKEQIGKALNFYLS